MTMIPIDHKHLFLLPHPHLPGLLILYTDGWDMARANCWTYRAVFISESLRSRGIAGEIFGGCPGALDVSTSGVTHPARLFRPRTGPVFVGGFRPTAIDPSKATKLGNTVYQEDRQPSHGSPWCHSEPLHPNIKISDRPRFMSLTTSLSSMPVPTLNKPLEKRSIESGTLGLDHLLFQFWESHSIYQN